MSKEEMLFVTGQKGYLAVMAQSQNLRGPIDMETFFAVTPDLLCVTDSHGKVLKANSAWMEILGYQPGEVEGLFLMSLVHPQDRPDTFAAIRALRDQARILDHVHRVRGRGGEYRFLEWRARLKDGLMYASARDITDRRRLDEQVLLLSKAVENSPATVIITDADGIIQYVNKSFTEVSGYLPEEIIGKNADVLNAGIQDKGYYRDLWDTISSGKTWRGSFQNRKKSGELYREYAVIAPVTHDDGTISHYISIKEDITARTEVEDKLAESRELLDVFFQQSLDGFFFMMLDEPVEWTEETDKERVLDYVFRHQRITRINKAMLDQYGAGEEDFLGLTPADFFDHNMDHGRTVWRRFFDNGTLHIDTQEQKFDGTPMTIEGDYICLYDRLGRIRGHFGVQREVTFEREARLRLEESEAKFRQLAENIAQVFFLRTENEMVYVSPAYETIWGRSCQSLYDDPESFIQAIHPEDRNILLAWQQDGSRNNNLEYRIVRPDGEVRWIWATTFAVQTQDGDGPVRIAGLAQDITERKRLEEQLRDIATRDGLTGLVNRRHLIERLEQLLERSRRSGAALSAAILDIDHFKRINDTHGHAAGDSVLRELARIMTGLVRSYDIVARYGGEEFVLIFDDTTAQAADAHMERILEVVRATEVTAEEGTIRFTFSCGIADTRELHDQRDRVTAEELIHLADQRLYLAKGTGRDRIISTTPSP
jgi:diguanylate cyclase (GGDEF)-like protein/PAS domain S-box-containing protein